MRKNPPRFFARTTAELDDRGEINAPVRQFSRMPIQQPQIRPRQTIFRQQSNGLEQRRTEIIVKIL